MAHKPLRPEHPAPFSLRRIAVTAFGPTLLFGLGEGAMLPVVVLSARELGASVPTAALIVTLIGVGSLLSNIPASLLTMARGERWALVAAALVYLINPLDAIPDALPGIGLVDDLAVLALTLERLSRFATPRVRLRARRMAPEWLARRDDPNTQPDDNNQQGVPHDGQEEDHKTGRGRVPFVERFRILP